MIITIPFKTPTINHLYMQGRHGRRFLSAEAVKLKGIIAELVPECSLKYKKLKVSIYIKENWLNKDGTFARKDISNREKFLVDSVFEALNIDDKYIFEHHLYKVQSMINETIVHLEEI